MGVVRPMDVHHQGLSVRECGGSFTVPEHRGVMDSSNAAVSIGKSSIPNFLLIHHRCVVQEYDHMSLPGESSC